MVECATVMRGVLHDSDVEERRLDPLHCDGHIIDRVENDLGVQMLYQMPVQTAISAHNSS